MIVFLVLAYFGGVLTILSPCILPVLPFVFARADRPFVRSGLPMLCGMALTFAVVATFAAVGGGWAVQANQYGRILALVLLALFGITLLSERLTVYLTRPLVALGSRLSANAAGATGSGVAPSFLLGVATGLLWAPCAGPILGLILTGAAVRGASAQTTLLLVSYAAGAATSLAVALLIGGRVFAAMKRSLGVGEWIRRALGIAVLLGVGAIAFGLDTGFLTRLSSANTTAVEQVLLDRFHASPGRAGGSERDPNAGNLPIEGTAPSLSGATGWLNSPPLTESGLRGKVVLVDFWTYSCINCIRALPYVEAWWKKYKDHGLVVIGVHSPEFAFEKNVDNVRAAVAKLGVDYPVAIDNDYAIWRGFNNEYWPAHYFIDARGNIRHHHYGEGGYAESERIIQRLLAQAGNSNVPSGIVSVNASGTEMAADDSDVRSEETYIGFERAQRFVSPGGASPDVATEYTVGTPALNQWDLSGRWTIGKEYATLDQRNGAIVYRFHARDLHLVLGPGATVRKIRFRVTLDGAAPGADHGVDTDANGNGVVEGQRLYQLARQHDSVRDRTFRIEFLDPGVEAFSFTFG
jgi:cytochrome c biogenesis protein CcdA/thiol-disulfide isomerase/thioredoxin